MIGLLEGILVTKTVRGLILKTGGVGYVVHVSSQLYDHLKINTPVTLHIHTHVTDSAITLFGFHDISELNLFELLLTVSGIGPRTALGIINRGVEAITNSITTADVDFFTSIPRLGKKNAQKIIIELKNKLGSLKDLDLTDHSSGNEDLTNALLSMGFEKKEVYQAIKKLPPSLDSLEQQLRYTLKYLKK